MKQRVAAVVVPILFLLSGLSALVFEIVFLRQLSWVFGSSSTAVAVVLAAFMAGLALGSALFGRIADRVRSPLLLYGLLEIGAGATGGLLAWLLGAGRAWLMIPLRSLESGALLRAVELSMAFAVLLIPTILMGGSLPALSRFVVRRADRILTPVGALYALNTLGGAVGVFVAGFILIERVGVAGSAYVAAGLDILVGLAAAGLALAGGVTSAPARPSPGRLTKKQSGKSGAAAAAVSPVTPALRAACLAVAAAGGFAVLGYEVVWTRLLTLPMRSFSYSFAMMLALFLVGLVVGALVVSALGSKISDPVRLLGWLMIAMGAYVGLSLVWMPDRLTPLGAEESRGFLEFLIRSALRSAPIVLPPTILSGMALPLAIRCLSPPVERVGRDVGRVYAANTLGAIAGSATAGLLLLPVLGAPRALCILAIVNVLAGFALFLATHQRVSRVATAGALTLAVSFSFLLPPDRFVHAFLRASRGGEKTGDLLFFHEGSTDTIAVVRKQYGFFDPDAKSLITNGVAMSATVKPVWRYMALEGHLPVVMTPRPSRGLALGVGTGITLAAVASHPEPETIDAVELSRGVARALVFFEEENGRVAERDPRVRMTVEDGRHFLELAHDEYDFITLEPPPPIVAGSVNLYSLDFYELCKQRLNEDGIVVQWLPLHAQSLESARMLAKTFVAAFPHVQLWLPSVRDAVLVGSETPLRMDLARLGKAYGTTETRANLRAAYLETPEALVATFLLDTDGVRRWASDVPVITDERPRMEFFRHQGGNMSDRDIGTLLALEQADFAWLIGSSEDFLRRVRAENRALRSYVHAKAAGDDASGLSAARQSMGSEFFLYPFGCTSRQLDNLTTSGEWPADRVSTQHRRCERIRGAI